MVPEGLKQAWDEAQSQIDEGEFDTALETLRGAWNDHGDAANHAKTWRLVGDAKQDKALADETVNRKLLREAHNAYEKALKIDPKNREARRHDNALLTKMDGMGIRSSSLPKLVDDGTPTIYGMIAIVVVGMMLLTSIKYLPEIKHALGLTSEDSTDWDATLTIELYSSAAPKAVDSFKAHAEEGRYTGIAFHRVIDGFMVQGGDIECGEYPLGTSSCGAGTGGYSAIYYGQGSEGDMTSWTMPDEFDSSKRHAPGILAMANSGPNTGGSQFYFVDKDSTPSHLDGPNEQGGGHTVFGMAISGTYLGSDITGIDLIDKISQVETDAQDRPVSPPYIHSIDIEGDIAHMHLIFP